MLADGRLVERAVQNARRRGRRPPISTTEWNRLSELDSGVIEGRWGAAAMRSDPSDVELLPFLAAYENLRLLGPVELGAGRVYVGQRLDNDFLGIGLAESEACSRLDLRVGSPQEGISRLSWSARTCSTASIRNCWVSTPRTHGARRNSVSHRSCPAVRAGNEPYFPSTCGVEWRAEADGRRNRLRSSGEYTPISGAPCRCAFH